MQTGAENVTWNLGLLYEGLEDPKIHADIQAVEKKVADFAATYYGTLCTEEGATPQRVCEALKAYESFFALGAGVFEIAYLAFSQDTHDQKAKIFLSRMQKKQADLMNQVLFVDLELTKLSEKAFRTLLQSDALQPYRHHLDKIGKKRTHLLTEKEEKLVNLKNLSGSEAHLKLYEELSSGFSFSFEVDGKTEAINQDQLLKLRHHPDSNIREKACAMAFQNLKDHEVVVENLFNAVMKDYASEAELRGFSSPRSRRNLENEVSDETVNTLIQVTSQNNTIVQEYYRLKTTIMGKNRLKLSDIYAPITPVRQRYFWDEAKAMIIETFEGFNPLFSQTAQSFFDERRIDARVHPTKRGGAFCAYVSPDKPVYVLTQYMGGLDCVLTLAHELGHGIHGTLSKKQTLLNYDTPLTMAEVASVFGEMLMVDALMKKMEGQELQSLICNVLEGMFATMHRQNMFSCFEQRVYEQLAKDYLPFESLSEIYWEEIQRVFGTSLDLNAEFRWEWAMVSHFLHTPFYVYAYNFAQLLVIALYQRYLEMGDRFAPKFIELLESGGSKSPQDLLNPLEIDLSDPDFWQGGFNYIRTHLLDRLKTTVPGA